MQNALHIQYKMHCSTILYVYKLTIYLYFWMLVFNCSTCSENNWKPRLKLLQCIDSVNLRFHSIIWPKSKLYKCIFKRSSTRYICIGLELLSTRPRTSSAQKWYILLVTCALVISLICITSALRPAVLRLWHTYKANPLCPCYNYYLSQNSYCEAGTYPSFIPFSTSIPTELYKWICRYIM